jgi:Na+-transporting NADH:ubiquinone oxidoreductase subunit C
MKLNKNSNAYTIIYIVVMVIVVGCALAFTAMSLRDRQEANVKADTMGQILKAVHVTPDSKNVEAQFNSLVTSQLIVNEQGEVVATEGADAVNVATEVKLPAAERQLPVYVCTLPDGATKYILPCYGAGLWGAIWGYVAFDTNGSTIYGAYFNHASETPGLGAEIEKPAFAGRFDGKTVFPGNGDEFLPVAVVKAGQHPTDERDYVDGVSGGTITSKGVSAMLDNCLTPYKAFLQSLRNNQTQNN